MVERSKARWRETPARLEDGEAARLAKALAHPARVRIVRLLLEHGACYCGELCEELPLAQSTVSQHLAALVRAGLVESTACGRASGYRVRPAMLAALAAWTGELARAAEERR